MYDKIAIMQPYLFPYIGYFQQINYVDMYIFHDDVQWIKGGWINRHTVNKNNNEYKLTLALQKHSSHALINEVFIAQGAKEEYLKQISNIYRKAPYYKDVYNIIVDIINYQTDNISELNGYSIVTLS